MTFSSESSAQNFLLWGWSDGKECALCSTGKFKSSAGSQSCTSCPDGATSTESRTGCNCGSTREFINGQCECIAGFTLIEGTCTECEAGTYKDTTGSGSCTSCDVGSSSAVGSDDVADCTICEVGYHIHVVEEVSGSTGSCIMCSEGTYKDTIGPHSPGESDCTSCPSYTTSEMGSTELIDCTCQTGYTAGSDGVQCSSCLIGTSKDVVGPSTCEACVSGTYAAMRGQDTCTECPSYTSSVEGSSEQVDCKCTAGYTAASDGVECDKCPKGTYKHETGAVACSVC
ncbi:hypothetical protein T484DRAFT_1649837, partial [Baffinella frigidus]